MNLNVEELVLEEIALEGLEGITLQSLWVRISVINFPLDIKDEKVRRYLWNGVILSNAANGELNLYALPQNRPTITLYNRYDFVNAETGTCVEETEKVPDDVYDHVAPVCENGVRGSCVFFREREEITSEVLSSKYSFEDVQEKYGDKLVIVAVQRRREEVLRIPYAAPIELSPLHYCILERVGRSRHQGEVTIGKEALGYKEDPKTLFYYRKKLIRNGLLKKQSHIIYEQRGGLNRHGLLLLLPRFYVTRLTPMELAARKINDILLEQPNLEIDYYELRDKIGIKNKMFRHVFPSFLKNFKVVENEVEEDEKIVTKRSVRLIKSVYRDDDSDGESEEGDEEDNGVWKAGDEISKRNPSYIFHPGAILADRTMMTQALHVIETCRSPNGISLREIGDQLRLPKLEIRSLARTLERLNEITAFRVEDGRQKRTQYLPRNRSDETLKLFDEERKNLSYSVKDTITSLRRANLILETVKELKIIDQMFRLKKVIQAAEKDSPYSVDQKSVRRLVHKLALDGHVRSIKMMLECNGEVKRVHIICDPSITADSPIIRDKIEQLKFRYFGYPTEVKGRKWVKKSASKFAYELKAKEEEPKLPYVPSMARKYGAQPKMKKALILYRFLFYILCTKPDPSVEHNDWKRFIHHLPNECIENETCTLGDIIPRMPLSIFVQIVLIMYLVPGLEDFLNDPIKKHNTLSMLSTTLRKYLFYKRKFVFSIVEVLTSLSYMDLVSISYKEQHPKESVIIKMKRSPKITDGNITKEYDLQTLDDFETYVDDLAVHCMKLTCENCSLDPRLFAHNQRNWTYTHKVKRDETSAKKRKAVSLSKKTELQSAENEAGPSGSMEAMRSPLKRKLASNEDSANKKSKVSSNTYLNRKKPQMAKRIKKKSRPPMSTPTKTPRLPQYDHIDLAALKLMKNRRVDWTREEDSFLLMCRVASILLDPSSPTFICVNRNVVRDELHRKFPDISKDKTAKSCQRRLMYMLKREKTRQNVMDWVVECRQDVDLMNIERPDVPRSHQDVWSEVYLKILHSLLNKFQAHHLYYTPETVRYNINSLEDLVTNYDIIKGEYQVLAHKPILHQDPQNIVDIYISVVLNVLISSLMLTQMKESTPYMSNTLFRIYQRYQDTLIRSVATRLQSNGIMTKTKHKVNPSSLRSRGCTPYKISQHYLFMLKTRLCLDSLLLPVSAKFTVKDSDLNTDAAIATGLFAAQNISFNIAVPQNFLVYKFADEVNSKKYLQDTSLDDGQCSTSIDPKAASRYALHMFRHRLSMRSLDGRKTQEHFFVNRCVVDFSTENKVDLDLTQFNKILEIQGRYVSVNVTESNEDNSGLEPLISFIRAKKELGATYEQIVSFNDGIWPADKIAEYIEDSQIHRVGVTVFRYVHNDFISPWLVHSVMYPYLESSSRPTSNAKPIKFIARCWKSSHGIVNLKVLYSYLSAILGHIYINPGVSEHELINTFRVCLPPVQILELIEMLASIECVTITELESPAIHTLFESSDFSIFRKIVRHCEASPSAMVYLCRLKQLLKINESSTN